MFHQVMNVEGVTPEVYLFGMLLKHGQAFGTSNNIIMYRCLYRESTVP